MVQQQPMRELRRRSPALVVQDFEAVLTDYLATLASRDKATVAADYRGKFVPFYFAHNADPDRQRQFEDFLR